jgi:esterase
MASHLKEEPVIQFLLSSLQRDAQGIYRWRFDLAGIRAAYPALLAAPTGDRSYPGPVLFVKGGASDYIMERHWPAIRALFPAAAIKVMPGCGHWLHAEKPQLFNGIVARFLASQEQRKLMPVTAKRDGTA